MRNEQEVQRSWRQEAQKKPTGDYATGYAKPPKHSQFQPKQSGNPKGRPPGRPSPDTIFLREAARLVKFERDGHVEHASKIEVIFRQIFNLAVKGDLRAGILILNRYDRLPDQDTTSPESTGSESEPDTYGKDMIKRMLRRHAHLIADPDDE